MEFFFYAGPEVMIKHNTFEKVLIGNNEVKKNKCGGFIEVLEPFVTSSSSADFQSCTLNS